MRGPCQYLAPVISVPLAQSPGWTGAPEESLKLSSDPLTIKYVLHLYHFNALKWEVVSEGPAGGEDGLEDGRGVQGADVWRDQSEK